MFLNNYLLKIEKNCFFIMQWGLYNFYHKVYFPRLYHLGKGIRIVLWVLWNFFVKKKFKRKFPSVVSTVCHRFMNHYYLLCDYQWLFIKFWIEWIQWQDTNGKSHWNMRNCFCSQLKQLYRSSLACYQQKTSLQLL